MHSCSGKALGLFSVMSGLIQELQKCDQNSVSNQNSASLKFPGLVFCYVSFILKIHVVASSTFGLTSCFLLKVPVEERTWTPYLLQLDPSP